MNGKITVVQVEPGQEPRVLEIENVYTELKRLIGGGTLEHVTIDTAPGFSSKTLGFYCDDCGRINGQPVNFYLRGEPICGSVVFASFDQHGNDRSLTNVGIELAKLVVAVGRVLDAASN